MNDPMTQLPGETTQTPTGRRPGLRREPGMVRTAVVSGGARLSVPGERGAKGRSLVTTAGASAGPLSVHDTTSSTDPPLFLRVRGDDPADALLALDH